MTLLKLPAHHRAAKPRGHDFAVRLLAAALLAACWVQTPANAVAQQQRQLVVERIECVGNTKTRAQVIEDRLTIQPGDAVTPDLLDRNWHILNSTNFFKSVDVYTEPGSERGKVVVIIEVKERRWPYYQFEGGHSDLEGWYLVPVSFRFDNLFGRGNLAGVQFLLSDRTNKMSINFTNPRLFDASAYLTVALEAGTREFLHYIRDSQLRHPVAFGGLDVRFGGNRGLFKHVAIGLRSMSYDPEQEAVLGDSVSVALPRPINTQLLQRTFASFYIQLHADTRDSPLYPTRGFWGAASVERAQDADQETIRFRRLALDARFYHALAGNNVLAFNVQGGYVTEDAPFYQRFYLGGGNSVRGYPERRLTPIGYGTKLLRGHAELRMPFPSRDGKLTGASAVLFFDIGGLWQPGIEPRPDDLFRSAGFGLRFKLPVVGLTRMDFSFPLDTIDNNDFQFHLSLGQSF